jgi:trimethyllysine dioxygenase
LRLVLTGTQKSDLPGASLAVTGGRLRLSASDKTCLFPSTWLADQCRCPQVCTSRRSLRFVFLRSLQCFHAQTLQRLSEASASVRHSAVKQLELSACETHVTVEYEAPGEHATLHPIQHLLLAGTGATTRHNRFRIGQQTKERGKADEEARGVPLREVMESESGVLRVLNEIDDRGYAFVMGLEPTEACTKEALSRIGFMQNTIFGDFWSFTVDTESTAERLQHADTAYTGLAIEPHTDGSYALEPPGLQSFHVLSFTSAEHSFVESVLVDGFAVASDFAAKYPTEFELLCKTDLDWKYFDPNRSHLHCIAPVISMEKGTSGKIKQIRWNHYDRGDLRHLLIEDADMLTRVFDAIEKWRTELLQTRHKILYRLTPGMLVVFDNWRMLHGRQRFRGKRTLCGCYHDRQLFISRLSVLRGEQADTFA